MPDDWKQAQVSAIFKRKGNRKKAGNYISITCIMCKILEGCIRDHIVEHMMANVMDSWTMALGNGFSIDSIYLDYMKAFDTVPHKRLIYKLRMNGVLCCGGGATNEAAYFIIYSKTHHSKTAWWYHSRVILTASVKW